MRKFFFALILVSVGIYFYKQDEKIMFIAPKSLQVTTSNDKSMQNKILEASVRAESWSSIEKRVSALDNKDEVSDRIKLIDSLLESKQLVSKVNSQQAKETELIAFTEFVRERSLLYKRIIEMELSKIEKEEL
ncbi:MAG: hypothetical protein COW00_11410 [Bdellovibrio sp. CG12_big_fil_rev_8_21_14_0_65_39_13]|nr:MAG: hypothetical protein COW78_04910 [Bdellovibrio sp. CG22_combo_CG10-13_8_21_14_all_39_27]PIQ59329.1 MAG: hypothetical protein COW00_11410 [Bdellovibrio sp. CG12_big_fil_rev_8_21_14_0_65_39_13]PIR32340.1 MAG: hypothetical protein COV37_20705 [Bdellovibrio sp. CG11_big_fil_rev_8_21_14_0_20_39_38]PJB53059.1 MAG: hypothetical protein CO099_09185 [Bdellovibrio sp. CG_4_9_14_3_um_filter_39_7]